MALKSDDILLVQRGDQSYKMPASQLVTSGEVAPNLQAVTDSGNTTTNDIVVEGSVTAADGDILLGDAQGSLALYTNNSGLSNNRLYVYNLDTSTIEIELNANGSAQFAAGDIQLSAQGQVRSKGSDSAFQVVNSSDTNTARIAHDGTIYLGGSIPSTPNIQLNPSGTGIFREDIVGGDYVGGDAAKTGLYYDSVNNILNVKTATPATNNSAFRIWQGTSPSTPTASIGGDGSASFAGGVHTDLWFESVRDANGPAFQAFLNGDENATITAQGAATFAGGNDIFDETGKLTIKRTDGDTNAVLVLTDGSDAAQTVFYGNGQVTFVATNIQFFTGGGATFAGDVAIGGSNGNQTQNGVYLNKDGYVASTAPGTNNIWNGYQQGTAGQTSVISADGQAIFNARVSGTINDIDSSGAFDLKDSNFWTVAGPTLSNPSSRTAGQSGLFYCTGEVNSFGNQYSFSNGSTPTIPANSVVPYFVDATTKIRLGIATEAFV